MSFITTYVDMLRATLLQHQIWKPRDLTEIYKWKGRSALLDSHLLTKDILSKPLMGDLFGSLKYNGVFWVWCDRFRSAGILVICSFKHRVLTWSQITQNAFWTWKRMLTCVISLVKNKVYFWMKPFPHPGILLCWRRFPLKHLPHSEHEHGQSPVWVLW